MKVYLSGPMTGLPYHNRPAFAAAAAFLRSLGYGVVDPAALDADIPLATHADYMRRDLPLVCSCDAIAFLPGWERSKGANFERQVAIACGLERYRLSPNLDKLEREVVIGLAGHARVGKDTLAAALVRNHGFTRVGLADAVKDVAYRLNPLLAPGHVRPWRGCLRRQGADRGYRLASTVDQLGWERAKELVEVRELLQRLGTEAGRNSLGQDIWTHVLWERSKSIVRLVVPDVRFPNELDAIRARGGTVYRITRPGYGPINGHISESALDDYELPVVRNDGSLADLERQAARMASEVG